MNLKQQDRKILSPLSQFANNNSSYQNKREIGGSQIDKLSSILAGFSDMLDKKINMVLQNDKNKENYQKQREEEQEPRFKQLRFPIQNIKNLSEQSRQEKIKIFCSDLARKILAIGFKYFQQGKLNQQKLRHFFCNNFLFNIIEYCTQNKLTEQQLKMMDGHLKKKVFVFLQERYPQNQNLQVNSKFDKLVHLVDNIQSNSNDLIFMSRVKFAYKKNGDYSKQIMEFLNFLIKLSSPEEKIYEQFKKQMESIFIQVFDESWMAKAVNKNFVNHSKGNDPSDTAKMSRKDIKEQADKQKYKKSVKEYTKYVIGKKISDNAHTFTNDDISEQNLKANNPSIMRILTKWCEQLQKNFDQINIYSRSQRFRMEDGGERNLKKESRHNFYVNLCKKHKDVEAFIQQSMDNIYQNQVYMFENPGILTTFRDFASEDEGKVGYFASAMKKSYQNYLISYLNKLIHSILSAQQLLKVPVPKKQRYKVAINQISFKLGDLFRCKISSKQDQIISLYSYLKWYCEQNKKSLQIIRVKNRLSQSTKDILINLKFQQKIVVQMQLSINEDISNFMKCSSAVKHFLYQIQRATFGPLSQMCNVYSNVDPRAEFFRKSFQVIQRQTKKPEQKNIPSIKIISECKHEIMIESSFPCWCSECNKFSYSLNTAEKNKICAKNKANWNRICKRSSINADPNIDEDPDINDCRYIKCSKCSMRNPQKAIRLDYKQIRREMRENQYQKLKQLQKNNQNQKQKQKQKKTIKQLPQRMNKIKVLDLQVKKKIQKKFYLLYYNFKILFFQENKDKNPSLSLVGQAKNKNQFDQFLTGKQVQSLEIVQLYEAAQLSRKMNIQILKKYLKTLENKKKKHFILEQIYIKENAFQKEKLIDVQTVIIRGLPLKSTCLLSQAFPNARIIMINKNEISNIDNIQKWSEAYQLNLEGNNLCKIPLKIKQLKKLNFLVLSKNKFERFPMQVCNIPNLKILNIKNNKIKYIEKQIGVMKNLQILRLTNNGLMKISDQFSNLSSLKQLDLNDNMLLKLPNNFKNLRNLETLSVENNEVCQLDDDIFVDMPNLTKVYFTNNKCSKIPLSLFNNKTKLKVIDFAKNQLKKVSALIFSLSSLSQLALNHNQIDQLQGKLIISKPLKKLFLEGNKLKQIPTWINDLENLQKLRIGNQNLIFEMERIEKLINLRQIGLQNMKIEKFPSVLLDFKKLEKLSLFNNNLSSLPERICQMRLTEINLQKNNFTQIPKQLTSVTTLESCIISGNKIKFIPREMKKLIKLQKFQCTGNIIQNILQLLNINELSQLKVQYLKVEDEQKLRHKFDGIKLKRTETLKPAQQVKIQKSHSQNKLTKESNSQKNIQKSSQF